MAGGGAGDGVGGVVFFFSREEERQKNRLSSHLVADETFGRRPRLLDRRVIIAHIARLEWSPLFSRTAPACDLVCGSFPFLYYDM